MTSGKYMMTETLFKYRRLCRLAIRPIVPGLHHKLYMNDFVNYSLAWYGLQVRLMLLSRKKMEIFIKFYSKMAILKDGAKTKMIIMLLMNVILVIKHFSGGYFFSGRVVGIQSNYKRKCKLDEDGSIHNYTLDQLQA